MSYLYVLSFLNSIYGFNKTCRTNRSFKQRKRNFNIKFFIDNNIKISSNKCGTYFNMSLVDKEKLDELESYIADFNINT